MQYCIFHWICVYIYSNVSNSQKFTEGVKMCGIVGYIGIDEPTSFLISALEHLEYRGYDSSGIAVCGHEKINLLKKKGRISVLKNELNNTKEFMVPNRFGINVGIAHTRWATHGVPSDVNAHPFVSNSGKIAIVHNGIIENYVELKASLKRRNVRFTSQTDSEVVCALVDSLYNGDFFKAVKDTVNLLEGAFALAIICSDFPNKLICVKKDSPLIVGKGINEFYVASDVSAFIDKTKEIYRLQECEIGVIENNEVKFFDFNGNTLDRKFSEVDWNIKSNSKGEFDCFTLKEIMEQSEAVKNTISPYIQNGEIVMHEVDTIISNINKIYIVACGSSYHVGACIRYSLEKFAKITTIVDLASEFRYRSPVIDEKTLVVVISQSGETADSLAALREAKKRGSKVLSIVNVFGSSIAMESDIVLYTRAGLEIGVATTKAFSAQLAMFYLLVIYMSKKFGTVPDSFIQNNTISIQNLPVYIEKTLSLKDEICKIAKKYSHCDNIFFIGRGVDYSVCREGSLKFKELSYLHSESYAAGELKHGTISLVEKGTLVIAVLTDKSLFEKTLSNIKEVQARGASCIVIVREDKISEIPSDISDVIAIPRVPRMLYPSLSVIPLQIFAYETARILGRDIDKPRNLAKSVTVE